MRSGLLALSVVCVLLNPATGAAQTAGATTGAVEGSVTDLTGAGLPGVTITAAGDPLMAPYVVVSASDGSYRFWAMPPGTYTLSFALAGFETRTREGVRVSLGTTVTVIVPLTAGYREVVTVEGGSRLVDRRGTMLSSVFDAAELSRLPGARTMGAILAATPAVQLTRFDVGGSTAFAVGPFSVYGTTGWNRPTIEGISVSGLNPFGFAPDYGSFDNVSVGTGAYGPEWPSPGLHMQLVTKSGGNQYAGAVHAAYEHRALESHNIDQSQIDRGAPMAVGVPAREANRLLRYHDVNADAGGYLRKDTIWWYGSARDHGSSARQLSFPDEPLDTRVTTVTGKGTWSVTRGQRVIVFAQSSRNRQNVLLNGFLRSSTAVNESLESTSALLAEGLVWKGEWNAIVGTRLFVEARAGQFVARRGERPNGTLPRFEDRLLPQVRGGNRDWQQDLQRDQAHATVGYFRESRFGQHEIKAGLQVDRITEGESWSRAYPGDVLHVTENGAPREVYLFQTPSRSESGHWWYAAYVADTWQMNARLTLSPGLRFDRFRVFLPGQEHPAGRFNPASRSFPAVGNIASWNVIAPRLAASYDLFGNGRTIVKGSYGVYQLPPNTDLGFNVNPNERVWWERWKWSDLDGDGVWQGGEEFDRQEVRGGEALGAIDPGLKLPYVNELTARVEREAARDLFVATGIVWRGERQHGARQRAFWPFEAFSVPVPLRDPGPDGAYGTDDDGSARQVFELRPDLLAQPQVVVSNPPETASDHLTWEILARRRYGARWSLLASFAHTWNRDQAGGYQGQTIRANEYPATPNDFIHTDTRGRHVYRDWSARVFATWDGPWGIRVTPFLRHQSGQAFGRTLRASLNYGSIRVLAEPVGTRRQDNITLVDLRVDKTFGLGGNRVAGFVEVFNVLNANPVQNLSWETGSTFLRPLVIVPPRIVRVGFRLDW